MGRARSVRRGGKCCSGEGQKRGLVKKLNGRAATEKINKINKEEPLRYYLVKISAFVRLSRFVQFELLRRSQSVV
jgi:hypothetical protein